MNLIDKLIQDQLRLTGGNLSKVSRHLDVDYYELREKYGVLIVPMEPIKDPEPADIRTLGRPGFQRHVIAVKHAGREWPSKYNDVIQDARKKFDAGTHEMFQTTDAGWVVQYLIPRRRRAIRPPYFTEVL